MKAKKLAQLTKDITYDVWRESISAFTSDLRDALNDLLADCQCGNVDMREVFKVLEAKREEYLKVAQ